MYLLNLTERKLFEFNDDYYPFGMGMPGRKYSQGSEYRYGFNGKENDNEVKGEGNQQDYGMRVYDPRIAKFLSVDPVTDKYPELTPYQFASNRPIDGIDLDGLEWWKKIWIYVSPVAGLVQDDEIREGFVNRGKEFVHGLKNLPKAVQKFGDVYGKMGTLGGPFLKQQQKKQEDFANGIKKGGIAAAKELWELTKAASRGDKKAIGALGFEVALLLVPGDELLVGLKFVPKELKYLGEIIPVAEKSILNSQGKTVIRNFVKNEDDLLKIAEDAAGGSLDNFKPKSGDTNGTWWEGEIDGKKVRIEWEPGGHAHLNEGPHVRIQEWVPGGGKKQKGKWSNGKKYYIEGQEKYKATK